MKTKSTSCSLDIIPYILWFKTYRVKSGKNLVLGLIQENLIEFLVQYILYTVNI